MCFKVQGFPSSAFECMAHGLSRFGSGRAILLFDTFSERIPHAPCAPRRLAQSAQLRISDARTHIRPCPCRSTTSSSPRRTTTTTPIPTPLIITTTTAGRTWGIGRGLPHLVDAFHAEPVPEHGPPRDHRWAARVRVPSHVHVYAAGMAHAGLRVKLRGRGGEGEFQRAEGADGRQGGSGRMEWEWEWGLSRQPPATVPFPRSSSPLDQLSCSPHPLLSREKSAPIFLSNGKPLKSSLKSSCSSPSITSSTSASPLQSQFPTPTNHLHLRAHSEPTTPTPKNVLFPDRGDNETETENPTDRDDRFPFPVLPAPPTFEIDPAASSPVPAQRPSPYAHVHIESLVLASRTPHLAGTLLVRNLAYEKHVAVRFTLDDWQTVSEVSARHVVSLNALPDALAPPSPAATSLSHSPSSSQRWDRFAFTIRLGDYAHALTSRVLWLVARFRVDYTYPMPSTRSPPFLPAQGRPGPGGEWWDNNQGGNYRVGLRVASDSGSQVGLGTVWAGRGGRDAKLRGVRLQPSRRPKPSASTRWGCVPSAPFTRAHPRRSNSRPSLLYFLSSNPEAREHRDDWIQVHHGRYMALTSTAILLEAAL
ncbi:hypothetical protein BV22DRAFT_1045788 [Leucogyrophana mollusca]|uniref:Uncharacterized protein n=1 Tax=Leucogyrophana mollusca TaxID=85980 RepID=A0ACB8BNX1_9AGAM|nr:hypothetical protein BV22DRAFT_1045788 [Leucogyrophana mollusca]